MTTRKILHSIALSTVLATTAAIAQPGHGYPPPGQQRRDDRWDDRRGPDQNWRFRGDERDRFNRYYARDVRRWQNNRNRPRFYQGYVIPRNYRIRPVPRSYYNGLQAPPPGYQYGYYDGYVVAYNPTSRIIADVIDLVGAIATQR